LVVRGRIHELSADLADKRNMLVAQKLVLAHEQRTIDTNLSTATSELEAAKKALAEADKTVPHPDLEAKIEQAQRLVSALSRQSAEVADQLGLTESLILSIDSFTAAIRVVPSGGRRSPLATAALFDQLHAGAEPRFSHVLLVKAQPGQGTQVTNDKMLWFEDKFSTVIEVNVTYMLIATEDSRILHSGTATATATAHGNIGDTITFERTTHRSWTSGGGGQTT
jgi:hypothetical protein